MGIDWSTVAAIAGPIVGAFIGVALNNVTHTDPFISENAFPATPRGRMIFFGGTYSL